MIELKSEAEIARMREAGLVVAHTLAALRAAVAPGVSTGELDDLARQHLAEAGAESSFLHYGYPPFPGVICASVNEEIVHGIPSPSRVLREGDIVSLDFGAIVGGWHGDSAITVGVGRIDPALQQLLEVTEEALWRGMAAASLGGHVSDIGAAIEAYVAPYRYGIVEGYTGHGIGSQMHQEPAVPNHRTTRRGPTIVKGLCLAVEPMVNLGKRHTRLLDDDWTVVTKDGKPSAHFEHTFTVTDDGPWVLTALDGGRERLAALAGAVAAPQR